RHRDAVASAALLEALTPFFDDGTFQPPAIDRVIPLADGRAAYEQVARGVAGIEISSSGAAEVRLNRGEPRVHRTPGVCGLRAACRGSVDRIIASCSR